MLLPFYIAKWLATSILFIHPADTGHHYHYFGVVFLTTCFTSAEYFIHHCCFMIEIITSSFKLCFHQLQNMLKSLQLKHKSYLFRSIPINCIGIIRTYSKMEMYKKDLRPQCHCEFCFCNLNVSCLSFYKPQLTRILYYCKNPV